MGISPATFCTWGPGTGATAFGGAAQFVAASSSTITLESRFPNLFGTDGDYIEFELFQETASAWTVFGSTVSPDAIVVNDDEITVTDGTTTATLALDASLSTTAWSHIEIYRESDTLKCRVNGFIQSGTDTPVPVDLDIIGKNQASYTDVYSIQFRSAENSYLSKATPAATLQGADTGFWRFVSFELTEVGNHCIIDALSGNDGYRIEVENVYLSTHKLKWTVGDGTTTTTKTSDELLYVGDTVFAYLDLEDLGETPPGAGDTTFEGTYSPNSGTHYIGAQAGTTNVAGMKLHLFLAGDGNLSTAQTNWLINSGLGRAIDEIGAGTTVATGDIDHGYKFLETTGDRVDSFGSEDWSENIGDMISATVNNGGFETLDGVDGVFANWTEQYISGSGTTVNAETTDVHAGTYSLRLDMPLAGGQTRMIPDLTMVTGKAYDFSVYAKIDSLTGDPQFVLADSNNNNTIGFNTFPFSSTSWTEYTDTVTATADVGIHIRAGSGCEEKSAYFDNVTFSPQVISRAFGLRTSFLNAAAFTGYLRDVKINTEFFYAHYRLHTDAADSGVDENDGTATNVAFATTDPEMV